MKNRTPLERYLPVMYLTACVALVAALLPTVLRPPQPPPPSSAEFSPDAPPDENSEIVLAELARGQSKTAGATSGVVPGSTGPGLLTRTEKAAPRGRCYGNPPRQLESLYSPPCMPAFKGNNGGVTARGVTENDIRIGFLMGLVGNANQDGEIPDRPVENESGVVRTYRVLREYFNQNLELYGRKLRFFYVQSQREEGNPTQERAAAQRAVEEYGVFAAINETSVETFDELTKRQTLTYTFNQANRAFFERRAPYGYSATPSSTDMVNISAEYLCKQLANKPVEFTDDPSMDRSKRVFGMIAYQESGGYAENAPEMKRLLKERCDVEIKETVEYCLCDDDSGRQFEAIFPAIARMRAAGVTTIISAQDFISNLVFTQAADQAKYFPEWFITGIAGTDVVDFFYQQYSPTQWRHAFGVSMYEIPSRPEDRECDRAYRSIDPDNAPDGSMCLYLWWQMVQLFGAIQMAGPNVSAATIQKALWRWGRHPPSPYWRMAGGYGPGDYTYPDYAVEMWYDPAAPNANGRPGAYHYVRGGARFTYGGAPTGPSVLFKDPGITMMPRGGL